MHATLKFVSCRLAYFVLSTHRPTPAAQLEHFCAVHSSTSVARETLVRSSICQAACIFAAPSPTTPPRHALPSIPRTYLFKNSTPSSIPPPAANGTNAPHSGSGTPSTRRGPPQLLGHRSSWTGNFPDPIPHTGITQKHCLRCSNGYADNDMIYEIFREFGDYLAEYEVEKRSWESGGGSV
jgi:hypothetical protein